MTISRHNTLASWMFFILTSCFASLLFGLLINHYSIFKIGFFVKVDNKNFLPNIMTFSFLTLFFMSFIFFFIKKVSIDTLGRTICFKNIVTRQTKKYNFSDFDGFADTFLTHRYSSSRTIALVKDKKLVRYIDSFWVSNYDDVRNSLTELKHLGTYKFGNWKQLQSLLRQPMIE